MVSHALQVSLWLLLALVITACGSFSSQDSHSPESVAIKSLQSQGLATSYKALENNEYCRLKDKIDRDSLYAYQMNPDKKLSLDADRSGSFMMRINISHNPFIQKTDCIKSAHRGLAPSLVRETRAGTFQDYSGQLYNSLKEGDMRTLAQDIRQEFGS